MPFKSIRVHSRMGIVSKTILGRVAKMEQNKYLSFSQKIAYGTGDLGSNFFYTMVSSFTLIYLTDIIGLNPAIVGTIIMVSKFFDGITDVFFGSLIDRTRSKMGKARPWMFFSGFPLAISMILIFAIPESMEKNEQYIWFFIFYTCANALFYTANNISYATLSALITKNDAEKVALGSFRYIFAILASIIVSSVTVIFVNAIGGGAMGWRIVAIIYAVLFLTFNSLASLSCKEVKEDCNNIDNKNNSRNKDSFLSMLKAVFTNKYYILLLGIYLFMYTYSNLSTSIGVYYFKYVIGNPALLGVVSMASMVIIIGLIFNPVLVKKYGIYKVNLVSYIIATILTAISMIFAYSANFGGLVTLSFVKSIMTAPLMGSLNAIVAAVARNSYLKTGRHTEGMMFSCSSIGMKIGGGIGAGLAGWLLEAAGYVGTAEMQSPMVISMIKFIYGAIPLILSILITLCLVFMKVEEENTELEKAA